MPNVEVQTWAVFERSFGPITLHERLDALVAMLCWAIFTANGAKDVRVDDFMPDWGQRRKVDPSVWLHALATGGK